MAVEILMPQLGLTMTEGTITRWFKQVGKPVKVGELFFEVATDKITNQIEATAEGTLLEILVPEGKVAPVKAVLAVVGAAGETVLAVAGPSEVVRNDHPAGRNNIGVEEKSTTENSFSLTAQPTEGGWVKASPAARKLAAAMSIDLSRVTASGPGGMVVEKDILYHDWVKASPTARKAARDKGIDIAAIIPSGPEGRVVESDVLDFAEKAPKEPKSSPLAAKIALEHGIALSSITKDSRIMKADVLTATSVPLGSKIEGVELVTKTKPITGMRKVIAERMSLSWQTTPHVHLSVEVDMTEALALKDKLAFASGQKASVTEIVIKCVSQVLSEIPIVNASIDGNLIIFHDDVNIGVAVALDDGLIVPVIRHTGRKSIRQIREALVDLGSRARAGRLKTDEITGGTFTVTNLGMFETDHFTPVINPPESAILGVCRTVEKPVVVQGTVAVRPVCNFVLGFDHRIIDGAVGARFMARFRELMDNPVLLLIG